MFRRLIILLLVMTFAGGSAVHSVAHVHDGEGNHRASMADLVMAPHAASDLPSDEPSDRPDPLVHHHLTAGLDAAFPISVFVAQRSGVLHFGAAQHEPGSLAVPPPEEPPLA